MTDEELIAICAAVAPTVHSRLSVAGLRAIAAEAERLEREAICDTLIGLLGKIKSADHIGLSREASAQLYGAEAATEEMIEAVRARGR